jgi:hypothetical protein
MRASPASAIPLLTVTLVLACDGTPTSPAVEVLAFTADEVSLRGGRGTTVVLRNGGTQAVGPVTLAAGPVLDPGGGVVPGASLRITPDLIPTLGPGEAEEVTLEPELASPLQPGFYSVKLIAAVAEGTAGLTVTLDIADPEGEAATVVLAPLSATMRQGDVVRVEASAEDAAGTALADRLITRLVEPPAAGFVTTDGAFVAYQPGAARLIARAGAAADTAEITIEARALSGRFDEVGVGLEQERYTSDLWVHGEYAYLGTWASREGVPGNTLFTWSVATPGAPLLLDSLTLDARTVNDVKVHLERPLAIATHELSEDGKNGVTLLDLTDPGHPLPISRFTEGLEPGIHNAWLEGDHAYLVVDGLGGGLRILDVSRPSDPEVVATWWAGSSFLHDVYVRDGLAFLSHWDAGLAILDVGNGIAGGSPDNPVEVSRIPALGGQTHNAWYWPEAGYVFVGEEDFATPGYLHVVDVRNLHAPREVATFDLPVDPPHNHWLDEERGVLFVAWYGAGVLALDVTGELLGDLSRQGRQIAALRYRGGLEGCFPGGATCAWAPQLHDGLLYLSDMNAGLVVLKPVF